MRIRLTELSSEPAWDPDRVSGKSQPRTQLSSVITRTQLTILRIPGPLTSRRRPRLLTASPARSFLFVASSVCECSSDESMRKRERPALAHLGICNAEPRLLSYFFLGDFMTPSAMHSHLPLRSIQVSTQT